MLDEAQETVDAIEVISQQTNTTKNGAREIRDIVDRMLNAVYNQALTENSLGEDITGRIEINDKGFMVVRR